jgi:uncharacterized protein
MSRGHIQTFTGRRVNPLAMTCGDINIRDIAHALANTCRFGGHAKHFYSVAEHCYLISLTVPLDCALEALLHDAAEAYVGDMVRPIKYQPEMVEFRVAERRIEDLIIERFGLSAEDDVWAHVKDADDRILLDETQELMRDPSMYVDLFPGMKPLGVNVTGHYPRYAEKLFLERYEHLKR